MITTIDIGAQELVLIARRPDPATRDLLKKLLGERFRVVPRGYTAIDPVTNKLRPEATPPTTEPPRSRFATRAPRSDPRRITAVQANPKRPGSAAFTRYELYRIGETVDQFLALGGIHADVAHDEARGYITLGMPRA